MSFLPRGFMILALCVPLAVLLGVMLADPFDTQTLFLVGACFLLLLSPFLLKHYHEALFASWNAFVMVFFLPGKPYLWMLLTAVGFGLMILIRALNRGNFQPLRVPSVAIPLLLLALIAYVTSYFTGGIGLMALGSDVYGGKKYFYLWFSVAAYFVLTSKAIPLERVPLLAGLYILGALTACFSNITYLLGPSFYFLFLLFPPEWGAAQAYTEQIMGGFTRVTGLAPVSTALVAFLVMRHGIKGILDFSKPWRIACLGIAMFLGFYSGFRSVLVLVGLLFCFSFFIEGLYKTKYAAVLLGAAVLTFGLLVPFANRLPVAMQRVLTILPLELDATAEHDARGTLEWRFEIWRLVSAEIPKYFWLGKGYTINPTDLYLAEESIKRNVYSPYEPAIIAGDYHSGPLSVIIPFGIFGVAAFIWFLFSSHRVLWRNFKWSPPELKNLNQFLLAYFYARVVFFFVFFGAFYLDLALFVGIVGLSISANAGVRVPVERLQTVKVPEEGPEEWATAGALAPAFTK